MHTQHLKYKYFITKHFKMTSELGSSPKKNYFVPTVIVLVLLGFGALVTYKFNEISAYVVNDPKADTTAEIKKLDTLAPLKYKKTIYLTFDDGPNTGSRIISNILNEEQIKATLFIVGLHVYADEINYRTYNTIKNNKWIELANHSYTHAFRNKFDYYYAHTDSAVGDFKRCEDSIHFTTNIARTPGRNIWRLDSIHFSDNKKSNTTADSLHSNGFTMLGWDLEWQYNRKQRLIQSDSFLLKQIENLFTEGHTRTPDHLVILAHDRTFITAEDSTSLHRLIINLKAKNEYNFEFVNRYPRSIAEKGIKK